MTLPRANSLFHSPPFAPGEAAAVPHSCMIVDANAGHLQASRRLIQATGLGLVVVSASQGGEVVNYLTHLAASWPNGITAHAPRAIFLEVLIPGLCGLDGLDLLRWVRSRPALDGTPTFVLTSSRDPEDVARARRLGASGFLYKHPPVALMRKILSGELPEGVWPGADGASGVTPPVPWSNGAPSASPA